MKRLTLFLVGMLAAASCGTADDRVPHEAEFFESRIRPLLATHCYECHGAENAEPKGGMRLDSRDGLTRGGDSGPAVVPHKPEESLLIEAVRYQSHEMPPDGKLKPEEIAALVRWVEIGAPWPGEEPAAAIAALPKADWDALRKSHWAWQPVRKPSLPEGADTESGHPIDQFVAARRRELGLDASSPAEPHILIRRLFLDLIGLPPEPSRVAEFVASAEHDRPAAIGSLIDELLASPHYGERWGRHWLDVARYSDGFGGFLDNAALPEAWRYRDWVVAAINEDLPYDQFIRLQVAGDLIGDEPADGIATGFFALGPTYRSDGGDPESVAQATGETLDDRMDTLGRGILGLTVSCARCHDHKFDPIPQQDYYSLAGVFNNTQVKPLPLADVPIVQAFDAHQQTMKETNGKIKSLRQQANKAKRELTDEEQAQIAALQDQLETLEQSPPPQYDVAHALADVGARDMPVALRGDLRKPGEIAPRRFLRLLAGDDPQRFQSGSGRQELADVLVSPNNPLTARVIVNRIWMHHFGRGLVRTPSNFGTLGEPPTHPELLDWLAATLVEEDWSIKSFHRLILRSQTYQQASKFNAHNFAIDADNRRLWRMTPRRMEVESWRDSLLSVTGELDATLGGPPIIDIQSSRRRTLYAKVSRNGDKFASDEFLRRFDFPLMRATIARRPVSVVPQQFLFLMNSPFMADRARALFARLDDAASDDAGRIHRAYRLLYGRPPSAEEVRIGRAFLAETGPGEGDLSAWEQYAQVLLSSNEFMQVR